MHAHLYDAKFWAYMLYKQVVKDVFKKLLFDQEAIEARAEVLVFKPGMPVHLVS